VSRFRTLILVHGLRNGQVYRHFGEVLVLRNGQVYRHFGEVLVLRNGQVYRHFREALVQTTYNRHVKTEVI